MNTYGSVSQARAVAAAWSWGEESWGALAATLMGCCKGASHPDPSWGGGQHSPEAHSALVSERQAKSIFQDSD